MNPLTNVIPSRYRKYVYAVLTLAALVYGSYQASDGDWATFVGSLIVALTAATAASNPTAETSGE